MDVPSYNTFQHVNSKLGRQHLKAPLAAALSPFVSLLYPPNPSLILRRPRSFAVPFASLERPRTANPTHDVSDVVSEG